MPLLKKPSDIETMAEGGAKLARVLKALASQVRPGITTNDIDRATRELIAAEGAIPAFLGYKPYGAKEAYPAAICTSVNDVVVHGIPGGEVLTEGDIVKLDLGLVWQGWYLDSAVTVPVGKVSKEAARLMHITQEALAIGIRAAQPGATLGDIGSAIQQHVEHAGFSVVRNLTGHGIGRALHEDPSVFNFGNPGDGDELVPGMVLALEPMVNIGGWRIKQRPDDSFVTADGSLSSHFEHTVAITEKGPRVLTAW